MYKVIITTVLDPEIKAKLSAHSKATYIPYSKLIEYSIAEFKKKINKSKSYALKHTEFDRIKTQSFTSSVSQQLNDTMLDISKELGISKRLLLREVITEFVKSIKK